VTAILPEYLSVEAWAFGAELNSLGFLFEPFEPFGDFFHP
jgi:hypothetical protein